MDGGICLLLIIKLLGLIQKGAQGTEQLTERFKESLTLLHFNEAWTDALVLKSTQVITINCFS